MILTRNGLLKASHFCFKCPAKVVNSTILPSIFDFCRFQIGRISLKPLTVFITSCFLEVLQRAFIRKLYRLLSLEPFIGIEQPLHFFSWHFLRILICDPRIVLQIRSFDLKKLLWIQSVSTERLCSMITFTHCFFYVWCSSGGACGSPSSPVLSAGRWGASSGRCMITPVPHADVSAVWRPLCLPPCLSLFVPCLGPS